MKHLVLCVSLLSGFAKIDRSSETLELDIPESIHLSFVESEELAKSTNVLVKHAKIEVCNRWEELVFRSNDFKDLYRLLENITEKPKEALFFSINHTLNNSAEKLNPSGFPETG